ncbi:type III polyketide synthase [Streptomyces noursei]|uniref:type III polyketide synthase n=1 Tax=Streptomyces noursei TaxID=1971 RepID=UPI001677ED4C|nr:type III polyketide synthase [Streptomyces noursei]MCZ1021227.1 type III polyketide synthase [Streptomyces noursei]GGX53072.1 polyketide synthase [Streptomyces noursei]
MAIVSKPTVAFPEHLVHTADIEREMEVSGQGPYLDRVKGFEIGVEQRYFAAPLEVVAQKGKFEERNSIALPVMQSLAVRAGKDALDQAGLRPEDIDCLITSNSTTPSTPGLDVYLVNKLGLRPDVLRMPATQLGCVGGAHTLAWAARLADAMPTMRILVVLSEALSTVYQPHDNSLPGLLWRQLFGDSAGACVVSSSSGNGRNWLPHNACLMTDASWQYVVQGTMGTYELQFRADGTHFLSKAGAHKAVRKATTPLREWIDSITSTWEPEVVIGHPGGPAVLRNLAAGLGFTDDPEGILDTAWSSLKQDGNLGGVAVLRILALAAERKPAPGSDALLVAIGPGVTGAAIHGTMI